MTKSGAPARGARVSLTTDSGWMQTRVIDAGSGYLCQMEPVAHFGLGREVPVKLEVLFPDGRWMTKDLTCNQNPAIRDHFHFHSTILSGQAPLIQFQLNAM